MISCASMHYRGRQLGAPQRRLSKRHGAQPRGIGVRIRRVATPLPPYKPAKRRTSQPPTGSLTGGAARVLPRGTVRARLANETPLRRARRRARAGDILRALMALSRVVGLWMRHIVALPRVRQRQRGGSRGACAGPLYAATRVAGGRCSSFKKTPARSRPPLVCEREPAACWSPACQCRHCWHCTAPHGPRPLVLLLLVLLLVRRLLLLLLLLVLAFAAFLSCLAGASSGRHLLGLSLTERALTLLLSYAAAAPHGERRSRPGPHGCYDC